MSAIAVAEAAKLMEFTTRGVLAGASSVLIVLFLLSLAIRGPGCVVIRIVSRFNLTILLLVVLLQGALDILLLHRFLKDTVVLLVCLLEFS